MLIKPPTISYRAYVLRLWQTSEPASVSRATLEDLHTGQRLAFATLADLEAFLTQLPADLPATEPAVLTGRTAR